MEGSTPATLYCLLVGAALVVVGIAGFFYEASFATGASVASENALGILAVNGWHNVVHIAAGCLLLVLAGSAARLGSVAGGALFLLLAALGFIASGDGGIGFLAENGVLIDAVPVNDEDNVLHLVLGLTGIIAAVATREAGGRAPAPA